MTDSNRIAENADIFADQVVETIPDAHTSALARDAQREPGLSHFGQLELATRSGIHLGASVGYSMVQVELVKQAKLIKNLMAEFDKALQRTDDADQLMVIADLRRPVATFLAERRADALQYLASKIEARTMVPAHFILSAEPVSAIPEDDLFTLGVALALNAPRAFVGWMLYRDDANMKCKCIFHLTERMEMERITPQDMAHRQPERSDYCAFGANLVENAKASYARHIAEVEDIDGGPVSTVTPNEAEALAADWIAKLSGRKSG